MDEPVSGSNKTRQILSIIVNHYAGANLRMQHPSLGGGLITGQSN
jgi:hypothetical protein